MIDDDMPDPIALMHGFAAVKSARTIIATHLRRMAAGEEPYHHFSDEHLMTRAVWLAAADMIMADGRTNRR